MQNRGKVILLSKEDNGYDDYLSRLKDKTTFEKTLVIAPNKSVIEEIRCRLIEDQGFHGIEFMTFDELMMYHLPSTIEVKTTEGMKNYIFKSILEDKELSYYESMLDKRGFYRHLSILFKELKGDLITSEEFIKAADGHGEKVTELAALYHAYCTYSNEESHYDLEDLYRLGIANLRRKSLTWPWSEVIVDGFYEFRATEREVLKLLPEKSAETTVYFSYGEDSLIEEMLEYLKKDQYEISDLRMTKFQPVSENIEVFHGVSERILAYETMKKVKSNYEAGHEIDVVYTENTDINLYIKMAEDMGIPVQWRKNIPLAETTLGRVYMVILKLLSQGSSVPLLDLLSSQIWPDDEFMVLKSLLIREDFNPTLKEALQIDKLEPYHELLSLRFGPFLDSRESAVFDLCPSLTNYFQELMMSWQMQMDQTTEVLSTHFKVYDKVMDLLASSKDVIKSFSLEQEEQLNLLLDQMGMETITENRDGVGVPLRSLIDAQNIKSSRRIFVDLNHEFPKKFEEPFYCHGETGEVLHELGVKSLDFIRRQKGYHLLFKKCIAQTDYCYLGFSGESTEQARQDASSLLTIFMEDIGYEKPIKTTLDMVPTNERTSGFRDVYYQKILTDEQKITLPHHEKERDLLLLTEVINRHKNLDQEYWGAWVSAVVNAGVSKESVQSITALERFAQCPFLFALERVLEVTPIASTFSLSYYIFIGKAFHHVIELFYRDFAVTITKAVQEEAILEADRPWLEDVLSTYFETELAGREIQGLEGIKTVMVNQLKTLIDEDLKRLVLSDPKFIPGEFEKWFETTVTYEGKDMEFKGVIDRIDYTANGEKFAIIDYKTSDGATKSKKAMVNYTSLQLPLYGYAMGIDDLIFLGYEVFSNGNIKYVLVGDKFYPGRGRNRSKNKEWDACFEGFPKAIYEYQQAIETGQFLVNPKECLKDRCVYRDVCRWGGRIDDEEDE